MTIRPRSAALLLAFASALALPGCFGPSNDKGDTQGPIITPKPSTVEDANTAGSRTTPLPDPGKKADAKVGDPADTGPK